MELEFHQLDLRYESLRVHKPDREGRLLRSLAEKGQQLPIVFICRDGFEDCGGVCGMWFPV